MPPATWPAAPDREPHQARDLLGLGEEMLDRLGEVAALERHDPLIALVRHRLVEGDREIALAEQAEQRRLAGLLGEPFGVEADIAAQLAAAIVGDQEVDDAALGARLQRQLPAHVLQHRAEQGGQHQGLGEGARDRGRIIVRGEDLVEHRPEPHQPPARVPLPQREADRGIERGGRRRPLWFGRHRCHVATSPERVNAG